MWQSSFKMCLVQREKKSPSMVLQCHQGRSPAVGLLAPGSRTLLPPAWLDLGKGSFGGNLGAGRAEQWDRGTWH